MWGKAQQKDSFCETAFSDSCHNESYSTSVDWSIKALLFPHLHAFITADIKWQYEINYERLKTS